MRRFWIGFDFGLAAFVALNLLAAHLASDCGLPGLFGLAGCADDLRRAGFPFLFLEQGGFVARNSFSPAALLADLGLALVVSAALGWWLAGRKPNAR
ncbi:MAG: hypothetical protein IT317_16725 [Anaerolineales bacterium]|nr:hypothetical protein [Anaerolineales bacterium]